MVLFYRTTPQVMVISSEGYFYSYNIDLENGGECSLMKQYRYVRSHRMFPLSNVVLSLMDSADDSSKD